MQWNLRPHEMSLVYTVAEMMSNVSFTVCSAKDLLSRIKLLHNYLSLYYYQCEFGPTRAYANIYRPNFEVVDFSLSIFYISFMIFQK
jgi:hypothetical protein